MSLRYFNTAGADPDREIGEQHDPETHLIPIILDAAEGNSRPKVRSTETTMRPIKAAASGITSTYPNLPICAHVLAPEKLIDGNMNDFINLFIGTDFSVIVTIQKSSSTKWYRTDSNSY
jgi:UDP-glucose 4-epimerase